MIQGCKLHETAIKFFLNGTQSYVRDMSKLANALAIEDPSAAELVAIHAALVERSAAAVVEADS